MKIAFVGCGAAGRPLGRAWHAAGHEIGAVHARTNAAAAVEAIGAGFVDGPLDEAEVVVFGTPDDALEGVAARTALAAHQTALHLSGFHPSSVLAPTGAAAGGLHPLRAFADVETSVASLPGTFFFVEGDAAEVAEQLARDAGGRPVRVSAAAKTLYHAGAAVAANYSVTLLALARDLFVSAGVEPEIALEALGSLALGALRNVQEVGLAPGLTGPAARGDVSVVAQHIAALDPEPRALYVALLRATIPIAHEKGALSPDAEAALRRLVEKYS